MTDRRKVHLIRQSRLVISPSLSLGVNSRFISQRTFATRKERAWRRIRSQSGGVLSQTVPHFAQSNQGRTIHSSSDA